MPRDGLDLADVERILAKRHAEDFSYEDGTILGSMCTAPHEVARRAHDLFASTNLGDPGHFPGAASLEAELLSALLDLAHAPEGAKGLFVSGGTEANLIALNAGRKTTGGAEVILPETAHFSFEKAASLMDLTLHRVPAPDGRMDVEAAARLVNERTAAIVAVAGTTELGFVDPVADLAGLAEERGVPLHVDAALGGFLLPFLEEAGHDAIPWDFALPGVTTITLDPHKMGSSTIPGGVLLARSARFLEPVAVETPYVSTDGQETLVGTRPGGAVAAAWAVLHHLGRRGYADQAREALRLTALVRDLAEGEGLELHPAGDLNVVMVRAEDPAAVQAELTRRGWRVNAVPRMKGIRLVAMPHVTEERLRGFMPELADAVAGNGGPRRGAKAPAGPPPAGRGNPARPGAAPRNAARPGEGRAAREKPGAGRRRATNGTTERGKR